MTCKDWIEQSEARLKRIDEELDRDVVVYGTAFAMLSIGTIVAIAFWLGTMIDLFNFQP